MTVRELIALLQACDQDKPVVANFYEYRVIGIEEHSDAVDLECGIQ